MKKSVKKRIPLPTKPPKVITPDIHKKPKRRETFDDEFSDNFDKEFAFSELKRAKLTKITCPICNNGVFGSNGLQAPCCDNSDCKLYSVFLMSRCGICGTIRRECCC